MKHRIAIIIVAIWAGIFVPAPWGISNQTIPTCQYGVKHDACVYHTLTKCKEFYMPGVTVAYAEDCKEVKPS